MIVNALKASLQYVLKMSWRRVEEVFKTSWRRLEDVLKTFWRRLEDVLARRLEDVFWRRMIKAKILALMKTSSRCLLKMKTKDVFKTSSSRRMFAGNILTMMKLVKFIPTYSYLLLILLIPNPLYCYLLFHYIKNGL